MRPNPPVRSPDVEIAVRRFQHLKMNLFGKGNFLIDDEEIFK